MDKAKLEAADVKGALDILNAGKGSESAGNEQGFSALKKRRVDPVRRSAATEEELVNAASTLHAWLKADKSALRGILSILSGDGLFFAAHIAEKTGRGWVAEETVTAEVLAEAVRARQYRKPASEAVERSDTDGKGLLE